MIFKQLQHAHYELRSFDQNKIKQSHLQTVTKHTKGYSFAVPLKQQQKRCFLPVISQNPTAGGN